MAACFSAPLAGHGASSDGKRRRGQLGCPCLARQLPSHGTDPLLVLTIGTLYHGCPAGHRERCARGWMSEQMFEHLLLRPPENRNPTNSLLWYIFAFS